MLEKLACAYGRNDEIPNIELAVELCEKNDKDGIKEIVSGLNSKDCKVANDCIKVLYEIGERKPFLIADYADIFLSLLNSKSNRLVWGSMTALSNIVDFVPNIIYKKIHLVLHAFNNGSVITVDTCITVLAKLCKINQEYHNYIFPLLMEHLKKCRPKEVAQHAERISICIDENSLGQFIAVLDNRIDYLSNAQQTRITKLKNMLKKIYFIT